MQQPLLCHSSLGSCKDRVGGSIESSDDPAFPDDEAYPPRGYPHLWGTATHQLGWMAFPQVWLQAERGKFPACVRSQKEGGVLVRNGLVAVLEGIPRIQMRPHQTVLIVYATKHYISANGLLEPHNVSRAWPNTKFNNI